jgi:hypothetical protein
MLPLQNVSCIALDLIDCRGELGAGLLDLRERGGEFQQRFAEGDGGAARGLVKGELVFE